MSALDKPETRVTVAVLTRNRLLLLRECLEAVLNQLGSRDEVVVVDTGSTDGTREWLGEADDPRVRLCILDAVSTDFGAARNLAVREAKGHIVAFLDDDCLPQPDWLEQVRAGLSHAVALGGVALFGRKYRFPWWWSEELAWTVGMSGRDTIAGLPDGYPSTSNLAALREEFMAHPFRETPHGFGSSNIYLGGREDAEWWGQARLRGAALAVSERCVVLHRIPADRLRWGYVRRRAKTDGQSAWARSRCETAARSALHEAADGRVRALWPGLHAGFGAVTQRAASLIWAARQASFAAAARKDETVSPECRRALSPAFAVQAAAHAIRRRAAGAWFGAIRGLRPLFRIPEEPRRILVAAPTFAGDTILLQPAVRMLARTWPEAELVVWVTRPRLLGEPDAGIRLVSRSEEMPTSARNRSVGGDYDVVFAPYYQFGDPDLWRRSLSRRGITFSSDVGFSRDRDYRLAAKLVDKDFASPEILNLIGLVSQWPMSGPVERPRLSPSAEGREQLLKRFPLLTDGRPYAALQTRPGTSYKDWPLERWAELARRFVAETGLLLVVFNPEGPDGTAEELIRMAGLTPEQAVPGTPDLEELLALLAGAEIVIGICSGPKHMAMALGTPTFTLYGLTSPARWGALFDEHLHGYFRSPATDLTGREMECVPVDHSMRLIRVEDAAGALVEHYTNVRGRTR